MSLSKILKQKKDGLLQTAEIVKTKVAQEKDLLGYIKGLEIRIEKLENKGVSNDTSRG